jgi:hypothetical protein
MVSPHAGRPQRRRVWMRVLAVAVIGLFCVGSALASPGINPVVNLTQPKGAIRFGGSTFVADTVLGFCRIDAGVVNPATCILAGTGQPELDAGNIVFIADPQGKTGVWRFTMGIGGDGLPAVVQQDNLAPNAGLGGSKPTISVLGPDGKLYIAFSNQPDIKRITNPFGSTATQTVESVAKIANGKRVNSGQFLGPHLYVDDATILERITNAAGCTGNCTGQNFLSGYGSIAGLESDRTRYLYFGSGNQVLRWDSTTLVSVVIYSQNGLVNGLVTGYGVIWGLNIDQATGDLLVGEDPTIEAAVTTGLGKLWVVPFPATTEGAPTVFFPPPPVPSPTPTPAPPKKGALYAAGITQAQGLLFAGSHVWVSDATQGFCRIDSSSPGVASLSHCFQPSASFVPGQASWDRTRNFIYVPDASATSTGVFRLQLLSGDNIGTTLNLGQGNPFLTACAFGSDGALYFPSDGATISKIPTASTTPGAAVEVGSTLEGAGLHGMAFAGNDLYMAEQTIVTKLIRASPSLSRGTAVQVGPPQDRTSPPVLNVSNPLSLAMDVSSPTRPILYIGSAPGGLGQPGQVDQWDIVAQRDVIYATQAVIGSLTTSLFNPGGMAVDASRNVYVADDPSVTSAGTFSSPGQGHVYKLQ